MEIVRSASIIALTSLCLATANPAAAVVANASLDWSNFDIFALGVPGEPAPTFSLSLQSTGWNTSASTANDSTDSHTHTSSNWTSAFEASSDTPNATADALASTVKFSTNTSATDSFLSNPFLINQASASLTRSASLALSGPAAVIFSVPYSISVAGAQFDFNHGTTANVAGSASFTPNVGSGSASSSRSFGLESIFTGPGAQSGTLLFGLVVDGAGVVNVSFTAATSAFAPDPVPVPEPSVTLTLLAGLAVIGLMFKRRMSAPGMGAIPTMV